MLLHRLCLGLLLLLPSAAHAQFGLGGVVYDPRNFAQNVLNYRKLVEQLTTQTRMYAAQVDALRKLAQLPVRDVRSTIATVDAALRQGHALGYTLANADAVFRQTFPEVATAQFLSAVADDRMTRTVATLRGALAAARASAEVVPNGLARLQQMKQQLATAEGHEQALEVNGAAALYSAEELMLLRQQMAAQTNAQAVYFALDVSERAQANANERAFLSWLATPPPPARTISFRSGAP